MKPLLFTLLVVLSTTACRRAPSVAEKYDHQADRLRQSKAVATVNVAQAEPVRAPTSSGAPPSDGCAAIRQQIKDALDRDEQLSADKSLQLTRCQVKAENEKKCKDASSACGTIIVVPPPKQPPQNGPTPTAEEPRAFDLGNPADVKAACGLIASAVVGAETGSTELAVLATPTGAYTCGAYLKAAANNDPLLIIAPTLIPTVQLARDLQDSVRKVTESIKTNPALAAFNPTVVIGVGVWNDARQVVETPIVLPLPSGMNPASIAKGSSPIPGVQLPTVFPIPGVPGSLPKLPDDFPKIPNPFPPINIPLPAPKIGNVCLNPFGC
jgi:hypothetical protein